MPKRRPQSTNTSKSALFQKVLEFVSFWLETNGYRPLASRIQGILEVDLPRDKKEVPTFNAMVNFIKNHIPKRAAVLEPIIQLTRDNEPFIWGEEQKTAFQEIK